MSRIPSVSRYRRPALTLALSGAMAAGCGEPAQENSPGSLQKGLASTQDLLVPTGTTRVVNTYAAVTADLTKGDTVLSVNAADLSILNLAPGDLLMVYQAQGAQIATPDDKGYGSVMSLGGAGQYEVFRVDSSTMSTSQIQISAGCGLRNSYSAAGKTQVIRVPRYHNVTLQPSLNGVPRGTITAQPWNGSTGGVVAVQADSIQDDGLIDVSGAGFRGGQTNTGQGVSQNQAGYRSTTQTVGGEKGESIAGAPADYDGLGGRYGRGAPANGGGGGNNFNASGGGGANAGSVAAYTGDGVMGNTQQYQAAWMLDPYYVANNAFATSSGGGRGGYTISNTAQDPAVVAPGTAAWGGDSRREHGGRGGYPLAPDATSRLFFGGGGGGGDADNGAGGAGGAGGGIVLLLARSMTAAAGGCVLANGASGAGALSDGAGGSGGGGSVVLNIPAVKGVNIEAAGGQGGPVSIGGGSLVAVGPGGGGGGGYIALPTGASQTAKASGGTAGTVSAATMVTFPVNGATNGGAGVAQNLASPLPVCLPAELSVAYTATPTPARVNTPLHYTATVNNAGPEDATNVKLTLTVPPGATVATTPAGGNWTCVLATATYTCSLPVLASGTAAPVITFIYGARQDAPDMLESTATLSADNVDPNPANNSAAVTITVDRTEVNGNGFSCSAAAGGTAPSAAGTLTLGLLLAIGAGLGRMRRRGPAAP